MIILQSISLARIDLDGSPIKTMTVCMISTGGLIGSHLLLSMFTTNKHVYCPEGPIKIADMVKVLWCIGCVRGGCIPMKEAGPVSMEHDWLALQETKEESEFNGDILHFLSISEATKKMMKKRKLKGTHVDSKRRVGGVKLLLLLITFTIPVGYNDDSDEG